MDHCGTTGAHVLRPTDATRPRDYGILRSFRSEHDMMDFYGSDLFKQWQTEVADMVEGAPEHRRLHGLEAFFRDGGSPPPARWKMAIVTWIGVFPVVLFWSRLLPPNLTFLHPIAVTGVVTAVAVITLAWFVMPVLTRALSRWLSLA